MICPSCKSHNEMMFSPLCHAFVCQEAECGLELAIDWQDFLEILLYLKTQELSAA